MAEKSGFFDSHLVDGKYDRVYLAANFAKYFASFIGNGVFGGKSNELMVQQKTTANMSIRVLSGQAWINGYWYENEDEVSLSIDVADGVLNRIDLIVLRWDNSERVIRLYVKKGTPATNAAAPRLQRDDDFYELCLAQIYVKAGAVNITQSSITDTRLDNSLCGLVQGVIQQFDTTEFGKQIDTFIKEFEADNIAKMDAVLAKLDEIAESNDIASLILDVDSLNSRFLNEILSIKNGGTGANNVEGARRNLGLEVLSGHAGYFVSGATSSGHQNLEFHRQGDTLYLVGTFDVTAYLGNDTLYVEKTFYHDADETSEGFFEIRENVVKPLSCLIKFSDGTSSHLPVYGKFNADGSIEICEIPPKDVYGQIATSAIVYIDLTYMNHSVG